MNILAVETALGACSAALMSGGRVLAQEHQVMLRGHAESLAPMVQRIMLQAGMEFRALQRIAVTTGPGTFTGQRVGLAFARALGVALKIPVAGITTLEVMAEEALVRFPGAVWAITTADAKRGEIYLAVSAAGGKLLIPPQLIPLGATGSVVASVASEIDFSPVLAGTAAQSTKALLESMGYRPQDSGVRQPGAEFLARLAGRLSQVDTARPLYLRPPDATPYQPVEFEIRPATSGDAAVLAAMHRECFEISWSENSFRMLLESGGTFGFLAKPRGPGLFESFVIARTAADEAEILSLGTLPAARRRGLAALLMRATIAEARRRGACRLFLEAGENNRPALGLYAKLGFTMAGTRPSYYASKSAPAVRALILQRDLSMAQ